MRNTVRNAMIIPGLAGVLSSAVTIAPAAAQSFAEYPDTAIKHYTVSATTAHALRQQIRERGPSFVNGDDVTARAFYTFKWTLREGGPRRCKARVMIETEVIFPKHTNPGAMSPRLRADWNGFLAQLERHEMRHVQLAYQALPKLKAALESGPCKNAFRRAAKVEAALDKQQRAFDAGPEGEVKASLIFP